MISVVSYQLSFVNLKNKKLDVFASSFYVVKRYIKKNS